MFNLLLRKNDFLAIFSISEVLKIRFDEARSWKKLDFEQVTENLIECNRFALLYTLEL